MKFTTYSVPLFSKAIHYCHNGIIITVYTLITVELYNSFISAVTNEDITQDKRACLPLLSMELCGMQWDEVLLQLTAGEPCHRTHSVKCGLTLLCVLLLHLSTPFPTQTRIRNGNWLLPAQRISCTVEKTIGIFGMDSGFKNFFSLRILQKVFFYEGFNESCFSLHWHGRELGC